MSAANVEEPRKASERRKDSHYGLLAQIAWRWILSGLVGSLVENAWVSLVLALALFYHWFRRLRRIEFWQPFQSDFEPRNLWIVRLGMMAVGLFGVAANWNDESLFPYTLGWAALILTLLVESFFVEKMFSDKETDR